MEIDAPRSRLTGARIRARRLDREMTQAELARQAGISASYLNLIEHDRRRVGGRVLAALAAALDIEPRRLSEGVAGELTQALAAAASDTPAEPLPETAKIERLTSQFPGWSALIARQAERIIHLERRIAAMGDRMAHDPALSGSVHEVLSMVTAIRSSAAILVDEGLEPDWQRRFHRNIDEDSRRLAQSAQALAGYLTAGEDSAGDAVSPQEEVEAWLATRDFVVDGTEEPGQTLSDGARALLADHLVRVREDRTFLPDAALRDAIDRHGCDPFAIARAAGIELAVVLRRLAHLPEGDLGRGVGLVECDGSGAILFRRPIAGFDLPRYGAACALWPLFQALLMPQQPRHEAIRQFGRSARPVETWSTVSLSHPEGYGGPITARATMLVMPATGVSPAPTMGATCRLCPREGCPARREAAVL